MQLKTVRVVLYSAIAVLLGISIGFYALTSYFARTNQAGLLVQSSGIIGGPFQMTDQTGKTVTEKDLIGHPTLMFFGYTFCPDVCPTTLAEAGNWLQTLGPDGSNLQIYFVTVDPGRDTQAKVAEYLSAFDPRIKGLIGTPEQTAAILKDYRVFARKVPQKGSDDYLMDHSAAVYMMDSQGEFVGVLTYQEPTEKAIAKLKALVARG